MVKPKQWLADNGHGVDPNQRGRLSRAHIALIEQAVRDGVQIDGYSVSTAVPKTEAEIAAPKKVERNKAASSFVADVPDEIRSEQAWEAHTRVNGKVKSVGMREVCQICSNSLTYCYCRTPNVRGDLITFTARTTPFVRSW